MKQIRRTGSDPNVFRAKPSAGITLRITGPEEKTMPDENAKSTAPAHAVVMPPDGTSCGCRRDDGAMWFACNPPAHGGKPGIAFCKQAGNLVNPPLYSLVAVFEREADRDFVLALHRKAVTA